MDKFDLPLNVRLTKIVSLYTCNKLTMGNAYHLMHQAAHEYFSRTASSGVSDEMKHKAFFEMFVELSPDDLASIEIGYEGNHYKWLITGHKPEGWYMTRQEYRACLESEKKTAVETDAAAACSAP